MKRRHKNNRFVQVLLGTRIVTFLFAFGKLQQLHWVRSVEIKNEAICHQLCRLHGLSYSETNTLY